MTTHDFHHVTIQLTGEDGNAFMIMGRVRGVLRKAGVPKAEIEAFVDEAMSGDYAHLLNTISESMDVR